MELPVRKLEATKKSDVFGHILKQLKDKNADVRVEAIRECSEIKSTKIVQILINALSDSNSWVRQAATETLGNLENREAVNPLLKCLSDNSWDVRQSVAESLGVLLSGTKSCPLPLIRKLKDSNELVRIETVDSIGAIGDSRALPALWTAMPDKSSLVRSYIAGTIGELGSRKDMLKLRKRLEVEKSVRARLGCLQGLYLLGQRDVLPDILKILNSRDYRLRGAAANTLNDFIVESSNAGGILNSLRVALKGESTVAAKSILKECINDIRKRFKKKV